MKKKTLIFLIIIAIVVICAVLFWFYFLDNKTNNNINENTSQDKTTAENTAANRSSKLKIPKKTPTKVPNSYLLSVPFTSQAPYANWDFDHNEGCEEASVLMMKEFIFENRAAKLDPRYADGQILQMISYQKDLLGSHIDLSAEQTDKYLLKGFYKINARIVPLDLNILKQNIAQNKPVIIPFAGRELHNPNFKTPGPIYHMLIVKGYKNSGSIIITNDPGTRNGQSYEYSWGTIYNAAHDWNKTDDQILNGKKVMIVLE